MPDFTSALYLGMQHPAETLARWPALTTGMPAALAEPPAARLVAQEIAQLVDSARAVLGPSTFHLFWDLCGMLADEGYSFYVDSGAYPIARWGMERAAAKGAAVAAFRHHDAAALERLLRGAPAGRPVIVADGLCSACGCHAPLGDYLTLAGREGGLLLVDDTQALGILGEQAGPKKPYGRGGGGSSRRLGLAGPDILTISSLAKGFGAPLAILAGSEEAVRHFVQQSDTRVHCSPPSLAAVHAAARALQLNREQGEALRGRLVARVRQFRRLLREAGLSADGGLFPVQTLSLPYPEARQVYGRLTARGVRTVMRRSCRSRGPAMSLAINAGHSPADIEKAVRELAAALPRQRRLPVARDMSAARFPAAMQGRKS